jgi:hypothetical protein
MPSLTAAEMSKVVLCYAVMGVDAATSPGPAPMRLAALASTAPVPPPPQRLQPPSHAQSWAGLPAGGGVADALSGDGVLLPPLSPPVLASQALHFVNKFFLTPLAAQPQHAHHEAVGASVPWASMPSGNTGARHSGTGGGGVTPPLPRHPAADALYDLLEEVLRSRLDTHPSLQTLLRLVCTVAVRAACAPALPDRPLLLKALLVALNSNQLPLVARVLAPVEVLRAASAAVQSGRFVVARVLLKHLAAQQGLRSPALAFYCVGELQHARSVVCFYHACGRGETLKLTCTC